MSIAGDLAATLPGGVPGTGLPAGVRPGSLWRTVQVPPEYRTRSVAEARAALDREFARVRGLMDAEIEAWCSWHAPEPPAGARDMEERLDRSARDAKQFIAVVAVHDSDLEPGDEFMFRARLAAFIRRRVPVVLGFAGASCDRVQAAVLDAHVVGDDVLEAINGRADA